MPRIAFYINHLHEVIEIVEGRGGGNVVDEQEGIGFEIRGCPEAAVFFLAGGVGEGEEVGLAVYGASGGVGILWVEEVRSCPWRFQRGEMAPIVGSYLGENMISELCNSLVGPIAHSCVH